MRKIILAYALALPISAFAAITPGSDQAIGNLLDAASFGGATYDGARPQPHSVSVPVSAAPQKSGQSLAPAAPTQTAPQNNPAPAPPPDVLPTQAHSISDGYLGLYKEDDFVVGTGRCSGCRAPTEGKWYFLDDVIATPKAGTPALIWIGAHELVEGAKLSKDGKTLLMKDGTSVPFALVPKIESNQSYYGASTLAYLQGKTLRLRGEYVEQDGVKTFVARTIWPEDFRIDEASIQTAEAKDSGDIDHLVSADKGGAKQPFQTKLLWEAPGADRKYDGKPVMGVMLNGAQGDDDETLAGHFSFFTGRYGPNGSMADWMFDNFYDMNTTSEKGIIASMVPMDKYMTDLNSGQSWYRPSDLLVIVMKDGRVPSELQEVFKQRYAQYYAQDFKYEHDHLNCTALIADPVRGEGWHFPNQGSTPKWIAKGLGALAGKVSGNKQAGDEIYQSLIEEKTRGIPRAAFDSVGGDLMKMEGAEGAEPLTRKLSPLEQKMKEDIVAVIWVRMPQIPSSRPFGREPVKGTMDYIFRTGGKISKTVPTYPRPFPPPH